jgi:hypothetical protein
MLAAAVACCVVADAMALPTVGLPNPSSVTAVTAAAMTIAFFDLIRSPHLTGIRQIRRCAPKPFGIGCERRRLGAFLSVTASYVSNGRLGRLRFS